MKTFREKAASPPVQQDFQNGDMGWHEIHITMQRKAHLDAARDATFVSA